MKRLSEISWKLQKIIYQKLHVLCPEQKTAQPKKIIQTHNSEIKFTVQPMGSRLFIQLDMKGKGTIHDIFGAYRVKICRRNIMKIAAKAMAAINSVRSKNQVSYFVYQFGSPFLV